MSISTRIAAPHGAVFLVVGAFKSSALFAPHAACTRRLGKPSQLLNPGQRGPNVRATPQRKSSPARSQTAFKSPRDYVFTM